MSSNTVCIYINNEDARVDLSEATNSASTDISRTVAFSFLRLEVNEKDDNSGFQRTTLFVES